MPTVSPKTPRLIYAQELKRVNTCVLQITKHDFFEDDMKCEIIGREMAKWDLK